MKTIWSKNILIGLLMLTNLGTGTYILAKEHNIQTVFKEKQKKKVSKKKAPVPLQKKMRRYSKAVLIPATTKKNGELKGCYEELLARSPHVDEGKVRVQWMIHGDGSTDKFDLKHSDMDDESFQDCVLKILSDLKFPPPPDPNGTFYAHTFHFSRNDASDLNF